MTNARRKWHNYERQVVKDFKVIWFDRAATARMESLIMDHLWVDIVNTGMRYPQCKCYKNFSGAKVIETLKQMPEHQGKINTLFCKITNKGEFVAMSKSDFLKLAEMIRETNLFVD